MQSFIPLLFETARVLVATACAGAAIVGLTHWAVRSHKLDPFGAFPRAVRRLSDPVIRPLERRIVRSGGNPVNAPWWLFWIVVIVGLLLLSLLGWIVDSIISLSYAAQSGPRGMLRFVVDGAFGLLMACILIRVIGSWFGISSYNRWMRPFVWATEWLLEPLRRTLPPFGAFDISPMVAWLLLMLVRWFVVGLL